MWRGRRQLTVGGTGHDPGTDALEDEGEDVAGDEDVCDEARGYAECACTAAAGEDGFEELAEEDIVAGGDEDGGEDDEGELADVERAGAG